MPPNIADFVIENEVLFYIRNKLHSTPKDAVIDACVKFYSKAEVSNSVTTLEDALLCKLPKRNKSEKSDPMIKTVTDIYEKLWSLDAASTPFPRFVAFDLSRIPRARDNSDSLATTEQLLASVHDLKCRINQLESSHVTKKFLEESLASIGGGNATPTLSPPPPPPPLHPLSPSAPSSSQLASNDPPQAPPSALQLAPSAASSSSGEPHAASWLQMASSSSPNGDPSDASAPSLPPPSLPVPEATVKDGMRWGDVQSNRRPRKNTTNSTTQNGGGKRGGNAPIVIGKKVNAGVVSWKGADLTVARYIGRVAVGTTSDEILSSLRDKEVDVVELTPLTLKHNRFLSFKLVVKKSQLLIIENELLWPEGVIVGRFWSAKSSTSSDSVHPSFSENGS